MASGILQTVQLGGRLRNKIFLMMVVAGVVPIIAVGFLALYSINLSHRLDIASIEDTLIAQKEEEIQAFLNEVIGTFELQVSFEQVSDIELAHQHFLLDELLRQYPSLVEVAFVNLSGVETSRHGRFAPRTAGEDELEDVGGVEKFVAAKSGRNYLGPVYFTLQGPAVTIAAPVKNRNGIVVSTLAGEINLSDLAKLVERSRLGETGYLYVVDQDGFVISHSRFPALTAAPFGSVDLVARTLRGEAARGVEGQERYRNLLNEPVVAAADRMSDLGWGVVAEWPTRDADRIVATVRNQVLVALFLVLLATIVLSIVLANRIVGPIKALEAGTQLIAQGKFDTPVAIRTNDELEDLGAAFNTMMAGLKQLQELKDEFVFIAAHELRTPVTAIKGYLSMVLEGDAGPVSDSVKEFIGKVIMANQRLIQLVNDLLQVARSEAGRLTVQVVPVDIPPEVRAVFGELTPLADEKGIATVYEPSPALPKALADAVRFKEVMVNLVGNAIKYTVGKGTVTVSHEVKDGTLLTHVKDTGLGISKEAQAKLFEKFYRVQTEQTRDITGTGLGLFIVKQIVEKMNGKIWIESEEGKGSTFSFSLPLA